MAVEYKKFLAEFNILEKEAVSVLGDRKSLGDSQGNTRKLLQGNRIALGNRASAMKAKGPVNGKIKGFEIADFATDSEFKTLLDHSKEFLTNFAGTETKIIANSTAAKALLPKYVALSKRIDAEIAERKKKLFEPKSLPDMIKLAAAVHKEATATGSEKSETLVDAAARATPKPGAFAATFASELKIELNKGDAIRAKDEDGYLREKFQPRVLNLRVGRVNNLAKEVTAAATAARTAKTAKDLATAKAQLKIAVDKSIEAGDISADFSNAYEKNKGFLKDNPDNDSIFKAVSTMAAVSNKILKDVQALQSEIK